MGQLPEHLEKYKRVSGDPALPGAGRPTGSMTKLPQLPNIHVNKMPFVVVKPKRSESASEMWERQSPKTLAYLYKRMNMFIVYTEQGIHDPLGAEIFKMLAKELVKDASSGARKKRSQGTPTELDEGKSVKAFRKEIVKLRESYSQDAQTINDDDEQQGEYSATDGQDLNLSDIEDEF